jgi:uncharacterized membrane protein
VDQSAAINHSAVYQLSDIAHRRMKRIATGRSAANSSVAMFSLLLPMHSATGRHLLGSAGTTDPFLFFFHFYSFFIF